MARPYTSELLHLPKTLGWALTADIKELRITIRHASSFPLVAVGSGGSLTAAHLFAHLHTRYTGRVATVSTPLEVTKHTLEPHVATWLLSANGRNVDILAALASLAAQEPKQLGVICGRKGSPLAKESSHHSYIDLFDLGIPSGKDGFLATNSLLAFCAIITRAYVAEYENRSLDEASLGWFLSRDGGKANHLASLELATKDLWKKNTIVVLHDESTRVGAIDLESKFTEAALGHIQAADYRNFAHGRHHWVAKRGSSSGILAFITPESRDIAQRTLALIPKKVPIVRIEIAAEPPEASLASILAALQLTGWAGKAVRIDPGRPGVPEFGRRLYNLSLTKRRSSKTVSLTADEVVAIERKAGAPITRLQRRGDVSHWFQALKTFKEGLSGTPVAAVVFDYDGTLVDVRRRFDPPEKPTCSELERLLRAGVVIGIASGRGESIRKDLRKSLPPALWPRVIIGYYNGADIGLLSDDTCPDGAALPVAPLAEFAHLLRSQPELQEIAEQKDRKYQITLKPRIAVPENRLWDIANQLLQLHNDSGLQVVRSSHSIDILAPGVSKRLVLEKVKQFFTADNEGLVLKIGDRGQWPGNDFELLSEPNSLSVDEVSNDLSTCWNLAPRGQRGSQATLYYCQSIRVRDGSAWFEVANKKK